METDPLDSYWSRSVPEALAALQSESTGLSETDAAARLERFGPNAIEGTEQFSPFLLYLRQLRSPLVLILLFGATISAFVREWIDALIIVAIIAGGTLLGFFQEYRASTAMAELRKRLALTTRALRDGFLRTTRVSHIVPGDVVQLSAGNLVPGDGLIVEARDFLVTESALTGESFPVEKRPGVVAADAPLAHRINCVFAGTSARSGTATVLVVYTGRHTVLGGIAARLRPRAPETEFARGLRRFGYLLIQMMMGMVGFVLVVNEALGRPPIESLLFAMALAVGLSPELLPAIVSVTLSAGARVMAARGVIIRRLESIENLGSMDVLCTDKTGTLTQGDIVLTAAVDSLGTPDAEVAKLAYLNAYFETGIDNPLDAAVMRDGENRGIASAGFAKVDEIPYDFARKRIAIVVAEHGAPQHLMIVKGAFAELLAICRTAARDGADALLSPDIRDALMRFCRDKAMEGFRVLAVAMKRTEPKTRYGREDESALCLRGFLLFHDPVKPQAHDAVRNLAAMGIAIKIVTGDNRHVAAHVAESIGLDPRALLTGTELSELRDEALWNLAERSTIFAEVDPQQKELIVRALQRRGHAVGYLGDGINDAAALHTADVGISVDSAVDVARESADVVLLKPDLDVLRTGVSDGRRTFANTLKYIGITTSANFGNMISMALATPLLPFLPLAAKQILLNNFLSDLPSVAISSDNVDASAVCSPRRWSIRDIRQFMMVFGIISSAFDGLTFLLLLWVFHAGEAMFQTGWFVVSLLTELAVVLVLRTRGAAIRSRPSRLLLWTTALVGALTPAFAYFQPVAAMFGFVPLPLGLFAALLIIVAAYIVTTEITKLLLFTKLRT
jgi:P-type Mg2+ transporter